MSWETFRTWESSRHTARSTHPDHAVPGHECGQLSLIMTGPRLARPFLTVYHKVVASHRALKLLQLPRRRPAPQQQNHRPDDVVGPRIRTTASSRPCCPGSSFLHAQLRAAAGSEWLASMIMVQPVITEPRPRRTRPAFRDHPRQHDRGTPVTAPRPATRPPSSPHQQQRPSAAVTRPPPTTATVQRCCSRTPTNNSNRSALLSWQQQRFSAVVSGAGPATATVQRCCPEPAGAPQTRSPLCSAASPSIIVGPTMSLAPAFQQQRRDDDAVVARPSPGMAK
jgi:hypothetical protein